MSTQRAHPEAYGIGSGVPMLAGETRHIGREGTLPMHPVGGSPRLPVGVPGGRRSDSNLVSTFTAMRVSQWRGVSGGFTHRSHRLLLANSAEGAST